MVKPRNRGENQDTEARKPWGQDGAAKKDLQGIARALVAWAYRPFLAGFLYD